MMQNSSELEHVANLLALSANVVRVLADSQMGKDRATLSLIADDLDEIAIKLVDLIFPESVEDPWRV